VKIPRFRQSGQICAPFFADHKGAGGYVQSILFGSFQPPLLKISSFSARKSLIHLRHNAMIEGNQWRRMPVGVNVIW
jgi:hypothetical protein